MGKICLACFKIGTLLETMTIITNAQKQGLSLEQYVMSMVHKDTLGDMLLAEFLDSLPMPKNSTMDLLYNRSYAMSGFKYLLDTKS